MTGERSLSRDRWFVLGAYALALVAGVIVVWMDPGMSPIWVAALADLAATALIFEFSRRLDNSSMYDPYWSVAPIAIGAYWWLAGTGELGVVRPALVCGLVLVWGVRLTRNWVRRWGGLMDEDWRYVMLRNKHGARYWTVSFLGIHFLPTVLVFLGCLPLFAVLVDPAKSMWWMDGLAGLVTAAAIWIETRADVELHKFRSSRRPADAVLSTGLWSLVRHPNYLGEILFWWGLWLFGVAANPAYWWSAIGALSITVLFVFISVPMIDERMLERRPGYAKRMRTTPALVPRMWRR